MSAHLHDKKSKKCKHCQKDFFTLVKELCQSCYQNHRKEYEKVITGNEKLNHIMLNRATDEQIRLFCKAINYIGLKERLNGIYGK